MSRESSEGRESYGVCMKRCWIACTQPRLVPLEDSCFFQKRPKLDPRHFGIGRLYD